MKKFFNLFLMLRVFGVAALIGLTFGSSATGVLAAQERGGGSYESPSFDFTLSWDDSVWEGEELTDTEGVQLNSDLSYAMIQGFGGYDAGAEGCLEESAGAMAAGEAVAEFDTAPRRMDRPETARKAVGELFTYVDLNDLSTVVFYVECRDLAIDGAVLQVIMLVHEPDFEDSLGDWEELLAEVQIGGDSKSEDEDDNSKIGKSSNKSGIDGNVYTDASAGFSAEWDEETWSVRKTKEDEGLGIGIEVATDYSVGWITGDPLKGSLEDCVTDFADGVGEFETISKMKKAPKSLDVPETDGDAVGGLYTYTDITGDPTKMVAYFECRFAADEDYSVTVLLATPKEFYADELPVWEELLSGISAGASADDESEEEIDEEEAVDEDEEEIEDEEIDEEEEEVAVEGATFAGSKYGFEVTYDDTVWVVEDLSDVNNDFFDVSSAWAVGTVMGFNLPYDAAGCLQALVELKASGEGITNFDLAPESYERPKTSRSATGELFTYNFDGQNGPVEAVVYLECRSLQDGAATMGVMLVTVTSIYQDALPVFETLLAGVNTGIEA